jgi:dipeptidyl aminopeptidase/acylaminoacyl peptidase
MPTTRSSMRVKSWVIALALAVVLSAPMLTGAATTRSAFAGANGRFVFAGTADGNADVYVIRPDGSGRARLTTNPASDLNPAWSPDGNKIAFASDRDGTFRIYTMNADGANQRAVSQGSWDRMPSWSPDGSKILFMRSGTRGIVLMAVRSDGGGGESELAQADTEVAADWAPDGSQIAYSAGRDIVLMRPDGTDKFVLAGGPMRELSPRWSPDGTKIAFVSDRYGNFDVLTVNRDGSGLTRLTFDPRDEVFPRWSPDGSRLFFAVLGSEMVLISPDGSDRTSLLFPHDLLGVPDWQPAVDLVVGQRAQPKRVVVGALLRIHLTITNAAPVAVDGITVVGKVTGPAARVAIRARDGSCVGGVRYRCRFANLLARTTTDVTITLRAIRAGTIAVSASTEVTGRPEATPTDNRAVLKIGVRSRR